MDKCLDLCLDVCLDMCLIFYVEHRVWYYGIIVPIMLGCRRVQVLYC